MAETAAKTTGRLDVVRLGNVTIFKRDNERWYGDYCAGNRRVRKSIGTLSKKVAIDWATAKNAALVRGEIGVADDRVEVSGVIKAFLDHQRSQTSNALSTVRRYSGALAALTRYLGRRPNVRYIGHLDVDELERFRTYRRQIEECDPKTVDGDMAAVSSMLTYAVKRGQCRENAARRVKPFRMPKPRPPIYTPEQVEAMIGAAEGRFKDVLIVLAGTGLRVGELEHLEWSDIDLAANRIHIRIKADWRPKDKSERSVPVSESIRQVLERLPRDSTRVFTDGKGNPLQERKLLKWLRIIQAKLGIKEGGLHTCRHYFVSRCAAAGIAPFTVMSWVGHADIKMVLHYYHLDERHAGEAMKAFRL